MPSPYVYGTFGDLKTALASQLNDPLKVHWTDTELGIYLNSAFREWNSISRMFRDRGTFNTTANTTFYDLTNVLRNGSGEFILATTATYAQIIQQIKYMLCEPNPDDTITFTDDMTISSAQIDQVRNAFLLETGMYISDSTQIVGAGDGLITIDDDSVIDVRRITWTDQSGNITTLFREDGFTSFAFSPSWPQETGTPERYVLYPGPLLSIQLVPPPVDTGTLHIQVIKSGVILDDFIPAIVWGVIGDLLSSPGPGHDPLRVKIADARWQEGIVIGKQVATVMQSYINGVPVTTESVFNFDTFNPSWQIPGVPQSVGLLGANLACVAPNANDIYSVTMDVSRNAPKLTDADPTPIGREYIELFVDYAAYLALFKHGGEELQAALPAYDAFVKAAVAYNNRMNAQNLNLETMLDRAHQQEEQLALRGVEK